MSGSTAPTRLWPSPETLEGEQEKVASRALTLSSEELGVIAKIDVAEAEDGVVTPIDYKRGKRPHVSRGVYEPERVQVCLQALLLEEHGYTVEEGAIWYAQSRERVRIVLDEELRRDTRQAVSNLRLTVAQGRIPPPLKDSPKCPRCALVSICLPDEMAALGGSDLAPRPITVGADEALPLVVQSQRARIMKDGETLKIADEKQGDTSVRLNEVSDVALFGNVSITSPALATLMDRGIPVAFHSHGRLVPRPRPRNGPSQRRGPHGAVPGELRRGLLPAFRARSGRRQDREPADHPAAQLAWR